MHPSLCSIPIQGLSINPDIGELSVENIEDISWDSSAFDMLMLKPEHKEIVQSLVENHTKGSGILEDIIQGKGQNVVILLQ